MRRLLALAAVLALMFTTGCVEAINQKMASWEDHQVSELLVSWGPPQQLFDDGEGGRILVYTYTRAYTVPGSAVTQTTGTISGTSLWATSVTTYNPAQTYGWKAYRMFWVNSDGRIYRWAWHGV
jgi:hypothetical protein